MQRTVIATGRRLLSTTSAQSPPGASSSHTLGLVGFGSLCAGTFGLGIWQTKRYFEKYDLTEKRCKDLDKEPLNAWELISALPKELNARDVPSRRVSLTGRFDNRRNVLVGPRPPPKDFPRELLGSDTAGYIVVSPFVDDDGREVLVHRGWLPRSQAGPARLVEVLATFEGPRTIEGVLRGSEFLGNSIGAQGVDEQGLTLDIPRLAKRLSLKLDNDAADPRLAMIEEIRELERGGYPFTKQLEAFRNFFTTPVTHITYAATWFTLAIIGAVLTRRMFAPSRAARVHDAVEQYMVQQDARIAAASAKARGANKAATLVLPLVALYAWQQQQQQQRHQLLQQLGAAQHQLLCEPAVVPAGPSDSMRVCQSSDRV